MRFSTLAGIGLVAVSTAALAQVVGAPLEQKVPAAGTPPIANEVATSTSNDVASNTTASPADDMAPATPRPEPKASPSPRIRPRR